MTPALREILLRPKAVAVSGGAAVPARGEFNHGAAGILDAGGAFSGFHHSEFDPAAHISLNDYIICLLAQEDYGAGNNRGFTNGSTGGADPWTTVAGPVFYDNAGGYPINFIALGKRAAAADVTAAFGTWGNPPTVNYSATTSSTGYAATYAVIVLRGVNTATATSVASIQHNTSGDIVLPSMSTTFLNQLKLDIGVIKDTSGVTSFTLSGSQSSWYTPTTGGGSMEFVVATEDFPTVTAGISRTIAMAGTKPPHNAALSLLLRS